MQISGEYGTELLLRYSEEELMRQLERRRIAEEREDDARGEAEPARRAVTPTRRGPGSRLARLARFVLRVNRAPGERISPAATGAAQAESAFARIEPLHIDPLVVREHVSTEHEADERMTTLFRTHR